MLTEKTNVFLYIHMVFQRHLQWKYCLVVFSNMQMNQLHRAVC